MEQRQSVIDAVRDQFGCPTGSLGRAAGLLMTYRPSNRRRNSWAVALLDVRSDDRVLEIGFGPGLAIRELSRIAVEGYVCGIDHSELMVRWARRRNAEGLRCGVVDLRLGSVDELPEFDAPFDKILAVNATLFWREPVARLAGLGRVLRPGGLIAVAHQPRGPGATSEASAVQGREIAAALERAGFSSSRPSQAASSATPRPARPGWARDEAAHHDRGHGRWARAFGAAAAMTTIRRRLRRLPLESRPRTRAPPHRVTQVSCPRSSSGAWLSRATRSSHLGTSIQRPRRCCKPASDRSTEATTCPDAPARRAGAGA